MTEPAAWRFAAVEPGQPVVAVDPGLRTGYAVLGPDGAVIGGEGPWDAAMLAVQRSLSTLSEHRPVCVCEAFIVNTETAAKSQAPWSLEGIGCCRFLSRRFNAEFILQKPVEAKRFATNPRLKAQGWYVSTPGGHVNDAMRHLYLFLANRGRLVPPVGVV